VWDQPGRLERVGDRVDQLKPGDRVAWASVPGSYAEVVVAPPELLVRVPDGVGDEVAVRGRCPLTARRARPYSVAMSRAVYRVFGYFGLASVFGAMLYGFRYDPSAPAANYLWNAAMYLAWAGVHLGMTRSGFKRAVYGARTGSSVERQVYIGVGVGTWLLVLACHFPVPGVHLVLPDWVRFAADVGFILCVLSFFEGTTFAALDGLLGVPGAAMTHSHGEETPLLTEGQYARVRHPMYRAALLAGLCSLLIHPNTAQAFWCLMIGSTFVVFIPIEERELMDARGDAYRRYMQSTPWRLMRRVW
jgi:protein-S-isoprenylcysteine O-methyltransferase Ste14